MIRWRCLKCYPAELTILIRAASKIGRFKHPPNGKKTQMLQFPLNIILNIILYKNIPRNIILKTYSNSIFKYEFLSRTREYEVKRFLAYISNSYVCLILSRRRLVSKQNYDWNFNEKMTCK